MNPPDIKRAEALVKAILALPAKEQLYIAIWLQAKTQSPKQCERSKHD